MEITVHFLRRPERLREVLLHDGWKLEAARGDSLQATHPEVADEPTARRRLHELGLLTSPSLRIEFLPHSN